ncbi:pentapeptide repeat-containing protein [Leptolyngbya sp. FACHB-261]|uniref:pentapeptide repeat-containing protein n=1 Tax=Leptolyngbya sp. FACHB-261 TaxID=2692806 RepID=UPI00168290A7|nr:pentapeptide repeat-containing protein [Leptolyngbya sp. FACHB-261]MBD2104994.1 pentapeptide repeat-containing protein [Leptolyngbya sp. FACHB-261]
MANEEHLSLLKQGVVAWNNWRRLEKHIQPDLYKADLQGVDLSGANFRQANLGGANLSLASLRYADLCGTTLCEADLRGANLAKAFSIGASLAYANLQNANLVEAQLAGVTLTGASLVGALLTGANLQEADLSRSDLTLADLSHADLTGAHLVETNLEQTNLESCRVYGISAWDLNLKGAKQSNLIITSPNEATITVDDLEVAQFIYLLLNNKKIRSVIDTMTSKVVLILGRFKQERKAILDAIREELRRGNNYVPILFDFDRPNNRDYTETIVTLASMAKFVIADLTDPSSIPKELESFTEKFAIPVQPLIEGADREYSMFKDTWKYHWVLQIHRYQDLDDLLTSLREKIIAPAEAKATDLLRRRQEVYG